MILFSLSFLFLFESTFSFAATSNEIPEVCSIPSSGMTLYQKFQEEMKSALLGGNFGQIVFDASISVNGLFSDKVFSIPQLENSALDTILSSTWNNIKRLGNASLTTFALLQLSAFSVVTSNLDWLAILYQDRAIVREWRSLLQIDTTISQLAYHLWKMVNITAPLSDISRAEQVFLAYQDMGLLKEVPETIGAGTSYLTLLREMAKMNAAMKYFISANNTWALSEYLADKPLNFSFNSEFIAQLALDYSEVRSFSPCNNTFSALQSTVKNGFSSNLSAAKDSWKIISDASQRLSEAFSKTFTSSKKRKSNLAEQYFSEHELQRLRTMYGVDTSRITNMEVSRWKRLIGFTPATKTTLSTTAWKISSLFEQTVSGAKSIFSGIKDYIAESKVEQKRLEEKKKELGNPSSVSELSSTDLEQMLLILWSSYNRNFDKQFAETLNTTFSEVYSLYHQSSQDFVFAEITSWTPIVYSLIDQVDQANVLLGNNSSGLRNNVGKTCQIQCTNKGNMGCRPL